MVSALLTVNEATDQALKKYAVDHGISSKAKVVEIAIEWWLKEKGYGALDPNIDYWLTQGYENLE